MLRYLNRGLRDGKIWDGGFPKICRGNWEIMVTVRGAAYPVNKTGPSLEGKSRQLWILPPHSMHTWRRDPAQPCEVIVVHFAGLHSVMENFISRTHPTSVSLSPADLKKIEALYARLLPEYRNPRLSSLLIFEQGMIELCLLILKNIEQPSAVPGFDLNSTKVQQALLWYQEHLADGIGVREVAAAINLSSSHLRRLFQSVLQDTPKRIFQRAALEKACRFMAATSLSLKEIAYLCGYKGFSQFHRAFRAQYHQAPEEWRRNTNYRGLGIRSEALSISHPSRRLANGGSLAEPVPPR